MDLIISVLLVCITVYLIADRVFKYLYRVTFQEVTIKPVEDPEHDVEPSAMEEVMQMFHDDDFP